MRVFPIAPDGPSPASSDGGVQSIRGASREGRSGNIKKEFMSESNNNRSNEGGGNGASPSATSRAVPPSSTSLPRRTGSNLEDVVKIQSFFRGALIRMQAHRIVSIHAMEESLEDLKRTHNGYRNLLLYLMFLSILIVALVDKRRVTECFGAQQATETLLNSIEANADDPLCSRAVDEIATAGVMFCHNLTTYFWYGGEYPNPCPAPSSERSLNFYSISSREDILTWLASAIPHFLNQNDQYGHLSQLDAYGRFSRFNKVYGGALLTVKKRKVGACKNNLLPILYPECISDSEIDKEPYSYGFNSTIYPGLENVCPPLKYSEQAGGHTFLFGAPNPYPPFGVIAYNLVILGFMHKFVWLDYGTIQLTLSIPFYNGHVGGGGMFTILKLVFDFDAQGNVKPRSETASVFMSLDAASLSDPINAIFFFAVILYAMVKLFEIGRFVRLYLQKHVLNMPVIGCIGGWKADHEVTKQECEALKKAHAHAETQRLRYHLKVQKQLNFLTSLWTLVDWVNIALYFFLIIAWAQHAKIMRDFTLTFNQYGKLMEIYEVPDQAAKVTQTNLDVSNFVSERVAFLHSFFLISAISIIMSIVRIFRYVQFQSRLNAIKETISKAASDVGHFLIIWAELLAFFSVCAYFLFGTTVERFSTLFNSFLTLFNWNIGNFDIGSLFNRFEIVGPIFFVAYVIAIYLILLNLFLAIVLQNWNSQALHGQPVWKELRQYGWYLWQLLGYRIKCLFGMKCDFVPLETIFTALHKITDNRSRDRVSILWLMARLRSEKIPTRVAEAICRRQLSRSHVALTERMMVRSEIKHVRQDMKELKEQNHELKEMIASLTREISTLRGSSSGAASRRTEAFLVEEAVPYSP